MVRLGLGGRGDRGLSIYEALIREALGLRNRRGRFARCYAFSVCLQLNANAGYASQWRACGAKRRVHQPDC